MVAGRAFAGDPSTLRDALFGPESHDFDRPSVARYRDDAGEDFTLDRAAKNEALLKFEGDPEIWALRPTPGPRGDVIYKNDRGEPVLRATQVGGLTLFTPARPSGVAAAFMGQAPAPRSAFLGPEAFVQLVTQASARASRAAGRLVEFDVPEVTPLTEAVFAQAVIITSTAFARVAQRGKEGLGLIGRFADVRFVPGRGPGAAAKGQTMQITVAPQLGVAGRPSSEWVVQAISRR